MTLEIDIPQDTVCEIRQIIDGNMRPVALQTNLVNSRENSDQMVCRNTYILSSKAIIGSA